MAFLHLSIFFAQTKLWQAENMSDCARSGFSAYQFSQNMRAAAEFVHMTPLPNSMSAF